MKIVLVTGGFDPIHEGHIAYLEAAAQLGDALLVGVNSNAWLQRKKGAAFQTFETRCAVVGALACVDHVFGFDDSDDTALNAIDYVRLFENDGIIFANGGDRTEQNIPEMTAETEDIEFRFGVGGADKMNSSSDILRKAGTRETWLQRAVEELVKLIEASSGWKRSERRVRVSVGFPTDPSWTAETISWELSSDGSWHVFICPTQHQPIDILADLLHELCHVTVGLECGHDGRFAWLVSCLGFAGTAESTFVERGTQLYEDLDAIATKLGPYDHEPLTRP